MKYCLGDPKDLWELTRPKPRRHYFGAQALPLISNKIVCLHCGKPKNIGEKLDGRRSKCSKTRRFILLQNGATGCISISTGKILQRTGGHSAYKHYKNKLTPSLF